MQALPLTAPHRRRLREIWRSAGWPCRDAIELDLLAAGLLQRHLDADGRETLHLSDGGLQLLAATLQRNRAAFDAHEALVARVALQMQRAGRVVWRGLTLRAPLPVVAEASPATAAEPRHAEAAWAGLLLAGGRGLGPDTGAAAGAAHAAVPAAALALARHSAEPASTVAAGSQALAGTDAMDGAPVSTDPPRTAEPAALHAPTRPAVRWVQAMPDVFSIRHTTVEDYAEPVVHEIKVRRADLLADLRRPDKGAAYRALASQCWYVLAAGIGGPEDVPACYGVMVADAQGLQVLRPAPRRAMRLPFAVWMALARANAEPPPEDDGQPPLGPGGGPPAT